MLLLLLVYYNLAPHGVDALPVPSVDEYIPPTRFDLRFCRTLWGIVSSCLATIFSCTWVAVHRNIPDPTSRWYTVALVRVGITLRALLAPELIFYWAVQQWFVAGDIATVNERARKERIPTEEQKVIEGNTIIAKNTNAMADDRAAQMNEGFAPQVDQVIVGGMAKDDEVLARDDEKWTRTHGFFVIMGGFHLFDGKKSMRPLSRQEVTDLVQKGLLVPPSKDEIKDKSKGDAISKGVVLVQTMWFVMQCIARRLQHLPITELEVVTLAYTTVNLAIYGFWWHRPLSVMRPVQVFGGLSDTPSGGGVKFDWMMYLFNVIDGTQDAATNLSETKYVPIFYAGRPSNPQRVLASVMALAVAMIFGTIHCMAWSSPFPSFIEQCLWRISSIAILGEPGILALRLLLETLIDLINKTVYEILQASLAMLLVFGGMVTSPSSIPNRTLDNFLTTYLTLAPLCCTLVAFL